MTSIRWVKTGKLAGLIFSWLVGMPAHCAPPSGDYFSRVTSSPTKAVIVPKGIGTKINDCKGTAYETNVKWFEKFDDIIATHKPSAADRVILSRPFNQEAERVQKWTETADKVARNYRQLAKALKGLQVPSTLCGVSEYKDLTADWYNDAAAIYEDMIRPRRPSKTMEELDEIILHIKQRAQSLSQTNANLKAMDLSLRKTFRIHLARHDDALQQYVRGK